MTLRSCFKIRCVRPLLSFSSSSSSNARSGMLRMYDEDSGKVLLKADYIQTGYGDTLDASVRTVCFTLCVSHITHPFNTTQN